MLRKLLHLRRLLRLVPKLIRNLDALDRLLPKLEYLNPVLGKLGELEGRIAELEVLGQIVPRFERLDQALVKLAEVGKPRPVEVSASSSPHNNGKDFSESHEWNRLRILGKFVHLAGRAREIEIQWQKIQQAEFDAHFKFQTTGGNRDEMEYLYKKGITDGIKWCVNLFS